MFTALIQEELKLDAMQRAWQPNFRLPGALVFEESPEIAPFVNESPQEVDKPLITNALSNSTVDCELNDNTLPNTKAYYKTRDPCQESRPSHLVLNGSDVSDFPAQYIIAPVEPHQFPAVGVYVDKRIVPGFKYRVRPLPELANPNESKKCLFGGKGLVLKTIGRGYSRRFTFEAEEKDSHGNYFWSDNRPEGFAFELEVVSKGDKFTVFDANREAQATAEIMEIENPTSRQIPASAG